MYNNLNLLKIGDLTVSDLREILRELQSERTEVVRKTTGRLVYGLRGIQELFGCSHKTAQYYKDHVIHEAVSQNGRKIVVDAEMALKLFNERNAKNRCGETALTQGEASTPGAGSKQITTAEYGR